MVLFFCRNIFTVSGHFETRHFFIAQFHLIKLMMIDLEASLTFSKKLVVEKYLLRLRLKQ